MAVAPLSQTIFLTEDGSTPVDPWPVNIPPAVPGLPATITTPATIAHDGTPQVGEALTGIDPSYSNGQISRRRWLSGASVLATTAAYTPSATGTIRWSVDVLGNDGNTVETGSSINVTTASVTPTPTATIDNTASNLSLLPSQVAGYPALATDRQGEIAALQQAGGLTGTPYDATKSIAVNEAAFDANLTALENRASAPTLSVSGPTSVNEGNPSTDVPTLSVTGPTSVGEGNPDDVPILSVSAGPTTVNEGS